MHRILAIERNLAKGGGMMYYSDEIIEQVKNGNDIVDVISDYVKLKPKGGNHWGLCPFHNEKSPSFSVDHRKQMCYCFGCSTGGNVFTFIMKYENFTFPEAVQYLAKRANIELPEMEYSAEARAKADERNTIFEMNKVAATYFYAQLRSEPGSKALEYLQGRELDDVTIRSFGLGYANKYSDDLLKYLKEKGYSDQIISKSGLVNLNDRHEMYDKFWNRVMFPIMDANNKVIGFGGRVMGDGGPKYLNSPETMVFDKGRNLYGLNKARTSRKDYFIICEGYMDVIALHQAGFTNAVAALGTGFTPGQAGLIKRYVKNVYLTYDSDEAGIRAALRAVPILKDAGLSAKVIKMDPYKDPDEFIKALGAEAFEERIGKARNGFMYGLEVLEDSYDLGSPEGKTGFHREIASRLLTFEEELERTNYIEAVAQQYNISKDSLTKLVAQMAVTKGMAGQYERPKPPKEYNKSKEDSGLVAQRALITWMINREDVFEVVKKYIKPDDFTKEIYQIVADMLYTQYEMKEINPSKIINNFTNEEEHSAVAELFHTNISGVDEESTDLVLSKAIKETLIKVKSASIKYKTEQQDSSSMEALMAFMNSKKELEELKKVQITIKNN